PVPTSHNALWNAVVVVEDADGWRLPTEAQWEYAARAGTIEAFSNRVQDHRDHAALDPIGWFPFNRGEWNTTREVGRKQPNPWGLYDMHGNVEEWVWDWLGQYPSIAETDPTGASPTGNNPSRAIRGNEMAAQTLVDGERFNRSASRNGRAPFVSWPFTGFRLVRP
ncbi:MAG: formylglycine-generating enzyme family protein, partial [Spirochaetes bacterium]|nr:formylglycine-generating enzyme family protein [Spirochaetota bacterium]